MLNSAHEVGSAQRRERGASRWRLCTASGCRKRRTVGLRLPLEHFVCWQAGPGSESGCTSLALFGDGDKAANRPSLFTTLHSYGPKVGPVARSPLWVLSLTRDSVPQTMATMLAPPSNPHLTSPRLFLSGVSDDVDDREIVSVLQDCLKLRLDREEGVGAFRSPSCRRSDRFFDLELTSSGDVSPHTVDFESLDRAEKAYATCNGQRLLSSTSTLNLSLSPPSSGVPDPVASATPRLIKQLPKTMTASKLFDLTRPFGPLFRVTLRYAPPRPFDPPSSSSQPHFTGQAILRYYDEAHAQAAYEGLNFLEVEGQNITVQVYDEKRAAAAAAGKGRLSDGARSSLSGAGVGGPATPSRWATPSPSPSPSSAAAGQPSKYAGLGVSSNGEHRSPSIARSVSNSSAASASRWNRAGSPLDTPATPPSGSPSATGSSGGMRRTASGSRIDPCALINVLLRQQPEEWTR